MIDERFFGKAQALTLAECAKIAEASLQDEKDGTLIIHSIAPLAEATANEISFLDNPKYLEVFRQTKAGAIICHPRHQAEAPPHAALLLTPKPYLGFARIVHHLYPQARPKEFIHPSAHIHPDAMIGNQVNIGAGVYIGAKAVVSNGVSIGANSVIGDGVMLGEGCRIGALVSIAFALIGADCQIHDGVKIGIRGFGFVPTGDGQFIDMPQLGRVVIGNRVEIGANSTIDRGANGDTTIGDDCRIDNLVQIGHNVIVGKASVIVAQAGISGSTKIGAYGQLGGQVGVAGHLTLADQVIIAAKAGVTNSIFEKASVYGGFPARPIKEWRRQEAWLHREAVIKKPQRLT